MLFPALPTELVTRTPIYEGAVPVGGGLFPGEVAKVDPQTFAGVCVGSDVTVSANPLNDGGADPPVKLFRLDQEASHQVRLVVKVAAASVELPSANAPRLGNAKTIAVLPTSVDGR